MNRKLAPRCFLYCENEGWIQTSTCWTWGLSPHRLKSYVLWRVRRHDVKGRDCELLTDCFTCCHGNVCTIITVIYMVNAAVIFCLLSLQITRYESHVQGRFVSEQNTVLSHSQTADVHIQRCLWPNKSRRPVSDIRRSSFVVYRSLFKTFYLTLLCTTYSCNNTLHLDSPLQPVSLHISVS